MDLKSISLSKLLKSDLLYLVNDVIRIVKPYDVGRLHIEESFNMLLQYQDQVQLLAKEYGRNSITADLKEIHTHRLEYAGFIFTQLQYISRIKKRELSDQIHIAQLAVRLHLFELRKNSRPIVNGKLQMFLKEVDDKPKVRNAFEVLGLLSYIEELREVNQQYHEVYWKRQNSMNSRQKGDDNKRIQRTAQALLRNFFTQVNQVQKAYPNLEEEYNRLIRDLNSTIVDISKATKTRITLNKKRAAAKAKAALEAQPKVHMLSVNGKETGSVTIAGKKKEEKVKANVDKMKQVKKKSTKKEAATNENLKGKQHTNNNTIDGLLNILRLPPGDNAS